MYKNMATKFVVTTELGAITLVLRPDSAPVTVAYMCDLIARKQLDDTVFYRSDFVIQTGLHGSGRPAPPSLSVNETKLHTRLSNVKGAAAIAHWDVPDNGNSEWFISIKDSPHLDEAYGGYCVFAQVAPDDAASWATIGAIATAIAQRGAKPKVLRYELA